MWYLHIYIWMFHSFFNLLQHCLPCNITFYITDFFNITAITFQYHMQYYFSILFYTVCTVTVTVLVCLLIDKVRAFSGGKIGCKTGCFQCQITGQQYASHRSGLHHLKAGIWPLFGHADHPCESSGSTHSWVIKS